MMLCRSRRTSVGAAILLGGILVIAFDVGDYGVSWDESVHAEYAERVLDYFSTAGADRSCNEYKNLKAYGPGADLLASFVYEGLGIDRIKTRHLLSACFALLTVPAIFVVGRLTGDPWAGIVGGGLLLLLPRFAGHAFINLKDIPFACFFAWSIAGFASMLVKRRFRWTEITFCGVALGLSAAIRPAGFLMLWVFFGALLLFAGLLQSGTPRDSAAKTLTINKLATLFGIGWLVMILPWPWAHENPVVHPLLAMALAARFHQVFPVLFEGQIVASDRLPWYYLTWFLVITTPPSILLLSLTGVCTSVVRIVRKPRNSESLVLLGLLLWLFGPLLLWTIRRPNIYDGMRHFLFLLPAVATFAGLAWCWLVRICRSKWTVPVTVILVACAAWPAWISSQLHPYQMTYYNVLVGGLSGANGRFETDYWATSYKEGIEWINDQAALDPMRTTRVLVAANDYSLLCADHFRNENVRIETPVSRDQIDEAGEKLPAEFDFYLATYRTGKHMRYSETPIAKTVSRDGAVFAVVRANKRVVYTTPRVMTKSPRND